MSAYNYQITSDISFATATGILLAVTGIIEEQPSLTIDLAKAGRCTSVAVALLLQIKEVACKQKKTVDFLNIPSEIIDLAKLSNVENLLLH